MHQKMSVLIFFAYARIDGLKKNQKIKFDHSISCLDRLFFRPKKSLKFYYKNIFLAMGLVFFYRSTSFASPTTKPIGRYQWIGL